MFSMVRSICVVLATAFVSPVGAVSLFRQAIVTSSLSGDLILPSAPSTAAERTLKTLDTNGDGMVDPSEIRAFALAQGLDAETAAREFASVDLNGDGNLSAAELSVALDGSTSGTEAAAPTQPTASTAAPLSAQSPTLRGAEPSSPAALVAPAALPAVAPAAGPPAAPAVTSAAPAAVAALPEATIVLAAAAPPKAVVAPIAVALPAAVSVDTATSALTELATRAVVSETMTRAAAAAEMVKQISIEESEQQAAEMLDRQAAVLRADATSLAQATLEKARRESARAAKTQSKDFLAQITVLEEQARNAEVAAAKLRAEMLADATASDELMGVVAAARGQAAQPPMATATVAAVAPTATAAAAA